jgi:hypothetical protein
MNNQPPKKVTVSVLSLQNLTEKKLLVRSGIRSGVGNQRPPDRS